MNGKGGVFIMKIRFGIIGIGKISHRFMKGIQLVEDAEVIAVASRDQIKAENYSHQYNIARYYGSYEELVDDPDIDAIYIATPPPLHFDHIMLCLHYGKHVLCEKPFLTSVEEINEVFSFARKQGCFVMEAQKSVFLPATKQVKQWLDEGSIGKLKYVEASYCYQGNFPEDHFVFDRGGGSMFDVGVYPLSYLAYVVDQPIRKIEVQSITNEARIYENPVDMTAQIILEYESGVLGYVRSSISVATPNRACLYGDQGWIEVGNFSHLITTYSINR